MPVISDSSPLIVYAKIGRLHLVREVFTEVLIPPAVYEEVIPQGAGRPGAAELAVAEWVRTRPLASGELAQDFAGEVDSGEAEVIALALELGGHLPVLLDDLAARRLAKRMGLDVLGSARVVVLAKERRLVALARPILDELVGAGLHLGAAAYRETLRLAGEHMTEGAEE